MGISAKNIIKDFSHQRVLHGIDMQIADGEFVSISGRSGSGKSTLLYILSTLDTPTSGQVCVDHINPKTSKRHDIDLFRTNHIGFIFQFHYLLPEITALENVLLPPRNIGLHKEKRAEALSLLEQLEIKDQANKLPSEMSGGQMQRVAIARALIMKPKYIFADEPTGNLDTQTAGTVMEILKAINKENNTTIVLVTHEPDFSKMADREVFLEDGRVVGKT